MKGIFEVLFSKDSVLKVDNKRRCRSRCLVSAILAVAALFMLILNLKNNSMTMAYASIVLVAGFSLNAVIAGVFKKGILSAIIMACLVGFVLSLFAITGGNEGFAILWILLVPLFAINLLGIPSGWLLSTYFLFFLFVIFYSGANALVIDKYSSAFISRFPILYMIDYLIATFFSLQSEYYHRRLKLQAYSDSLTGAYNRSYFIETLQHMEKENIQDYAIIAIDLNGLKTVNDTLGHEAGDEIIKAVVECCKKAFDKEDIVCRIGGDEYSVIVYGSKKEIEKKAEKLQNYKKKWSGKLVKTVSFAVGVAFNEDEKLPYAELMKKADKEMYNDKMLFYQDKNHNRRKRD